MDTASGEGEGLGSRQGNGERGVSLRFTRGEGDLRARLSGLKGVSCSSDWV